MALTNSQYESIRRTYDLKQSHNRRLKKERQQELYERQPRLKELDDETASLAVQQARRLLAGEEGAVEKLKERYAQIAAEKAQLYAELGVSEAYLEPQYDCSLCQDTGYIEGKKCRCFLQKELELLYHQSRIRERLEVENFDSCTDLCYSDTDMVEGTTQTVRQYMRSVIRYCKEYANQFGEQGGNLIFYGSTGVGKTFLAGCIAKELIEKYFSVVYLSAVDLFDMMAKERFHRDEEDDTENGTQSVLECDLLIIDDLGTEMSNTWTNSQLFYCLNERLLRKKSTIITTNLTPGQLGREYSERVGSRFIENYRFISIPKGDIRIWKQREQRRKHGGEK